MAYTSLSVTCEREEVIDFSFPLYIEGGTVLYKQHENSAMQQFLFIRPYNWQFWICMGILIPSVGILIWGFDHIIKYIHKKEKDDVEVESIYQTIWSVLGVTFYQGKFESLEPIKFVSFVFSIIIRN